MEQRVYNAHEVAIVIGDALIEGGFADGEFLRIEPVSELTASVSGSDGSVAVSVNRDRRCTITLILLQTSEGNRIIQDKIDAALALGGSPSIGSFMVSDTNGQTIHEAEAIWPKQRPTATFDRTATAREWQFEAVVTSYEGGNFDV
jgi:hypothetical protein